MTDLHAVAEPSLALLALHHMLTRGGCAHVQLLGFDSPHAVGAQRAKPAAGAEKAPNAPPPPLAPATCDAVSVSDVAAEDAQLQTVLRGATDGKEGQERAARSPEISQRAYTESIVASPDDMSYGSGAAGEARGEGGAIYARRSWRDRPKHAARIVRFLADTGCAAADREAFECAGEGCPAARVSCSMLRRAGHCRHEFGTVFATPLAGIARRQFVWQACPYACRICKRGGASTEV